MFFELISGVVFGGGLIIVVFCFFFNFVINNDIKNNIMFRIKMIIRIILFEMKSYKLLIMGGFDVILMW